MTLRSTGRALPCPEIIELKKDKNQITFRCQQAVLPHWKAVIRYRYAVDLPSNGCSVLWTDYIYSNKKLVKTKYDYDDTTLNVAKIPTDWAQTSIRLTTNESLVIVLHVYATTCNILVQGKGCQQWIRHEFRRLQSVVHALHLTSTSDGYRVFSGAGLSMPIAGATPAHSDSAGHKATRCDVTDGTSLHVIMEENQMGV